MQTTVTNPLEETTTSTFDDAGRLIAVSDPLGDMSGTQLLSGHVGETALIGPPVGFEKTSGTPLLSGNPLAVFCQRWGLLSKIVRPWRAPERFDVVNALAKAVCLATEQWGMLPKVRSV